TGQRALSLLERAVSDRGSPGGRSHLPGPDPGILARDPKVAGVADRSRQLLSADTMATVDTSEPLRRAFYPLTLPLTVGPGSISVAITLGANAAGRKGIDVLAIVAALV